MKKVHHQVFKQSVKLKSYCWWHNFMIHLIVFPTKMTPGFGFDKIHYLILTPNTIILTMKRFTGTLKYTLNTNTSSMPLFWCDNTQCHLIFCYFVTIFLFPLPPKKIVSGIFRIVFLALLPKNTSKSLLKRNFYYVCWKTFRDK